MLMAALLVTSLGAWAAAQPVSLRTADGVSLRATAQTTRGARRGVVMVHMDGRDRTDWDYLADRLARGGMTTVAPDLRGHGESGGSADYPGMVSDVTAAVAWLRAQGVEEIACLGAELGANLCLAAAAQPDSGIASVAMLSPQLNHKGLVAPKDMKAYTDRPAMIVVSDDDPAASRCADILVQLAGPRAQYEVLAAAGSGTRMLSRDPALEGKLVAWLSGSVELTADMGSFRASTTEETTVESQGEKLRTHQ